MNTLITTQNVLNKSVITDIENQSNAQSDDDKNTISLHSETIPIGDDRSDTASETTECIVFSEPFKFYCTYLTLFIILMLLGIYIYIKYIPKSK